MLSLQWSVKPNTDPDEGINSVAVSEKGQAVAAGSFFFNRTPVTVPKSVGLYLYDNAGQQILADPIDATAPKGPGAGVRGVKTGVQSVAISRDGTWAAACGFKGTANPMPNVPGFIKAYDISSKLALPALLYPPEQTSAVALNEDGTYLAAGAEQLYLFTRSGSGAGTTWQQSQKFLPDNNNHNRIVSVAVSRDGQWIVAGIAGGYVALLQANNGTLEQVTAFAMPNGSWVMGVSIAADGTGFAVAGSDATVYYFDVARFPASKSYSWNRLFTGCSACRSVAVTDDGSLIAVSVSGAASPHHPTGKGLVDLLQNHGAGGASKWGAPAATGRAPNIVSIDSSGQFVVAADGSPPPGATDGNFYGFNKTGGPLWTYHNPKMDYPIQVSASGNAVVGGSDDGKIYYFA